MASELVAVTVPSRPEDDHMAAFLSTWKCRAGVMTLLIGAATGAGAQNPDLALTQAERDSILATYHQVFPIWGRKAIERGFLLPLPVGLNINTFAMEQGVALSELGLSTNENPIQASEFIALGEATSRVASVNFRGDLWVLPFLNVYGMYGTAWASTTVPVTEPVQFTSDVDQTGSYWGVGITTTIGIKHNWLAIDVNWTWTDLEKLDVPVRGRVLGLRYGRSFKVNAKSRANYWIGANNQKFATATDGSIALNEAIPPNVADSLQNALANYQNSPWYQGLGPLGKRAADSLVAGIMAADLGSTTINYHLDKAPADPWNMIIGGSYELTRNWHFRGEVGFIGRVQALLVLNYRLAL
ncbi:MAG TPA: hypothetical protein VNM36_03990 [Gemmatimonadaceae bacterium]|nr:hypothetical protein [Gemmatimonadaceae bacterium]